MTFKGFGLICVDSCFSPEDGDQNKRHFKYNVIEHTKMGETIHHVMERSKFRKHIARGSKEFNSESFGMTSDNRWFLFKVNEWLPLTEAEYKSYLEDWEKA